MPCKESILLQENGRTGTSALWILALRATLVLRNRPFKNEIAYAMQNTII